MNGVETVPQGGVKGRVRPLQLVVAGLGFCTVFIDSFATQTVAVAGPLLKRELAGGSEALGLIFGLNMLGGLIGALLFGALGDRYGRRPLVIAALVIIAAGSWVSASAHSASELALLRLLTGLGLGGALPNTVALVAEYAPPRWRSRFTAAVFNGFPLGAIIGSVVGARFVVAHGWRSIFLIGAGASAAILLGVIILLPESLAKLRQRDRRQAYDRLLARLGSMGPELASEHARDAHGASSGSLVRLFAPKLVAAVALVSVATFLSMLSQYSIMNWLPTLATEAGIPIGAAIISLALLNIGAIAGNLLLARIGDRRSPYVFTAVFYGLGGGLLVVLGMLIASPAALVALSLVGGLLAFGAQLSLTTITARLFDVDIRSTAVGWALAMGRVGAALGPMAAGWGFAHGMSIVAFMALVGLLFGLAGLSMLVLGRIDYTRRRAGSNV